MLAVAVLSLFPGLMAYAAASDLMTMTISNRVSVALLVGFVGLALVSGMPLWVLLASHLACGAAVLALTFALFAAGWIGGGDAKLAAATAVWLGWAHLFDYGVAASTFGGALTLVILVLRKAPLPPMLLRQAWAERLHCAGNGVPYGIALAAAGLALYPDSALWTVASS